MSSEPLQLPLFPDRAYLHKIVPEQNQKRFYAMTGSCVDFHGDEGQAVTALAEIAYKKAKRGYQAV